MSDLYRAQILDHARKPRHYGPLESPALHQHATNQGCGDVIDVYLELSSGGDIEKLQFTGQGCVLSQASASILCEAWQGRPIGEVLQAADSDVYKLVGVTPGPMRQSCVLLPFSAIQKAISVWTLDSKSKI